METLLYRGKGHLKKNRLVSSKLSSPDDLLAVKVKSNQHTQILVFLNHRKQNNHIDGLSCIVK